MTLVWLAICWTVGMLLGRALEAPLWLCAGLTMATALGLAAVWQTPRWRLALACALFMALGATRLAVAACPRPGRNAAAAQRAGARDGDGLGVRRAQRAGARRADRGLRHRALTRATALSRCAASC